jgi:hypothetical protein
MKYLLLALSALTLKGPASTRIVRDGTIEFVRRTIRTEVSAMGLKLLVGLILVSTIVFSIIQIGHAVHTLLAQFENGFIFEIAGFAVIALASSLALYFTFESSPKDEVVETVAMRSVPTPFDLPNLAFQFAQGFMAGLNSKRQIQPARAVVAVIQGPNPASRSST